MKRIEWLLARKEETVLNVFKLKTMVRENDSLAILIHGSPDPDAVASERAASASKAGATTTSACCS